MADEAVVRIVVTDDGAGTPGGPSAPGAQPITPPEPHQYRPGAPSSGSPLGGVFDELYGNAGQLNDITERLLKAVHRFSGLFGWQSGSLMDIFTNAFRLFRSTTSAAAPARAPGQMASPLDIRLPHLQDQELATPNPNSLLSASSLPILAGVGAVVTAAIVAQGALAHAVIGSVRALGQFSTAVIDAAATPAKTIELAGSMISSYAEKFSYLAPDLAIFGAVVGEATQTLGRFMSQLDQFVHRYADYNPQLATAEAMSEVANTLGDLSRAQRIGPELARYVDANTKLTQQYEEIKVGILQQILPIISRILEIGGETLDNLRRGLEIAAQLTAHIPILGKLLRDIRDLLGEEEPAVDLPDPRSIIVPEI